MGDIVGAIDWGYSYTKQIGNGDRRIFPSVVGNGYDKSFSLGGKTQIEELEIKTDKHYFIGDNAKRNSKLFYNGVQQNRFSDESFKALMSTSLGLMCPMNDKLKLVTGLPPKFYSSNKKELKETLLGEHRFELNGIERVVVIDKVQVLPQLVGTAIDLMYDKFGQVNRSGLGDKTFGIIDPGFGTTDYAIISKGEYRDDLKDSTRYNINELYRIIGSEIFKQHGVEVNPMMIEEIVNTGVLEINGMMVEVTRILEQSKDTIAMAIANHADSIWLQKWNIHKIFLTGGGGEMLEPYIRKYINVEKVDDAQWSNVRGYHKKAIRAWM